MILQGISPKSSLRTSTINLDPTHFTVALKNDIMLNRKAGSERTNAQEVIGACVNFQNSGY